MKQVDIRSIIIPSRSRSGNYPTGSTVTPGGGGSSTPVDLSPYMKLARWFENFEEKTDENNVPYLYCKKNLLVYGGVTSYSSGGNPVVPPIYAGIPFDNKTIWLNPETQLVEVIGGTGGSGDIDATKLWQLLGAPTSEPINISHLADALNGYATTEQLNPKWTQDNTKISHWDEAYTKSHEHSNKSILDGITSAKVSNWDSAYGWGDHNQEGYAHLANEETFTGLKHFTKGLSVGSNKKKIYESNGVVYIDGDLAVTGGVTAYALGGRSISSIMDGVIADEVTITVKNINGVKKLAVIGGTGGGEADSVEWNNIKNIPTWITDTKPTYNWSEIKNTPATLSEYGITDAFKIIYGTPDTNKGMSAGYWSGVGSYASFVGNNWGGQFKLQGDGNLAYRGVSNGSVGSWKTIAFTTSTIDNALHLNGKDLNYNSENPFGKIPFVATDGVMEVGRYIDFHTSSKDSRDYAVRLQATNTDIELGGYAVSLPSKGGTLALLTDNVASASKLQTARSIWGQSFDGKENISGNMSGVGTIQLNSSGNTMISPFTSDLTSNEAWYGLTFKWDSSNLKVCLNGYAGISFKTSGGGSHVMSSNGNVGIGTTSPTDKLHVNGNTRINNILYVNGYSISKSSDGYLVLNGDIRVKGNVLAEGGVAAYAAVGSEGELKSYFLTTSLEKQNLNADTLNASNMVYYPSSDMNTWTDTTFTNFPTSKPAGGFMLMVLKEGSYLRQIYSSYNDSHLYQRYQYFSGGKKWSGWLKIANSSDKVDSFDFSSGSSIKAPSGFDFVGFYKGTSGQRIAATAAYFGSSYGNASSVPTGSVYATEFKQASDIRKKNKLNDIIIPTDKIASAPIFRFSWKDTDRIDVGSSAQYWKEVLPDLVSELEGIFSMNYSNIALVCVVSLAKQMQYTIKELNKRIKKLEQLKN